MRHGLGLAWNKWTTLCFETKHMRHAIQRCYKHQMRQCWDWWDGGVKLIRRRCANEAQLWQQRWLCAQQDLANIERQELEARLIVHSLNKNLKQARLQTQLPMLRLLILEWEHDYLRIALAVWSSSVNTSKSSMLLLQLQETRRSMEETLLATLTPDAVNNFNEWKLVCDVENEALHDAKQQSASSTTLALGLAQR